MTRDEVGPATTKGARVTSLETTVALPLDQAEAAVRARLADHGFGVLSEIDVAATLRAKLGVERPPLKILGACNPSIAHRALSIDPSVALLLPCNVVLESAEEGRTRVAIADPRQLLVLGAAEGEGHRQLLDLAGEAASILEGVVAEVDQQNGDATRR